LRTRMAACGLALAVGLAAGPAEALSLTVAKKCHALTMQEYPRPRDYAGQPRHGQAAGGLLSRLRGKETAAAPAAEAAAPR
jgi:hypothetical protein